MAKVKLGAIVVDMRGKLGGHVFAQNRGGNYVRTKTTPTNPQTTEQSSVRTFFGAISQSWSALTQAGRDSFDNLVSAYAKTNVFGDLKNPTGKALFQRLNQNLALTNQTLLTACVNPIALVVQELYAVTGNVAGQTLLVTGYGDATGMKVQVYATPPMSQGTKFVKNKLRLLGTYAGVENDDIVISPAYIAKFGAIVAGQNIVVGIRTINSNGQSSPLATLKAVIS